MPSSYDGYSFHPNSEKQYWHIMALVGLQGSIQCVLWVRHRRLWGNIEEGVSWGPGMTKSRQDFFPRSVLHDLSTPKQMVLNPSGSNTLLFYSKYSDSPLYYSEMKFVIM